MRIIILAIMLLSINALAFITPDQFPEIKKKAEQGDPQAQCDIGECYDYGDVVTQDRNEAIKWYSKAADQGYARGLTNFGDRYYSGEHGLPQDYKEAVKWYRRAAEQGSDWALGRLGTCYKKGLGVPVNFVEAYACFNVLSTNDKTFVDWRDSIMLDMTREQIAEGQTLSMELYKTIEANRTKKKHNWKFWQWQWWKALFT